MTPLTTSAESLSRLAILTAIVLYLLAFLAHSVEWASLRGVPLRSSDPDAGRPVGQPAPATTSASGGSSASGAAIGSTAAGTLTATRPVTGGTGSSGTGDTGTAAGDDGHDGARLRSDTWARMGWFLTVIGALAQLVGVVTRGISAHRAPWGNMYEFIISALTVVVFAYVAVTLRGRFRWMGLFVTLLLTVGLGLAVTEFYVRVGPLVPALHSVWFLIHITAALIASAAFNLGAIASIGYLLRARAEKKGTADRGYLARLPKADTIDTFAYRLHAFGFPVWTFTVAAGAIWAEYAWGRFWGWDPKETWALITWVVYACYLHARATAGWRGRNAAIIAIIGVATFWFNYVGVNLLAHGLHSYAGV